MRARFVFDQQNGDVTKKYYAELECKGLEGSLAVALFRAHKRSTAAKRYRGRGYSREAYDVKQWSLSEICRILQKMDGEGTNRIVWGWKYDAAAVNYEWCLYVELPQGQVSFHNSERLAGPEFTGKWDGQKLSAERIIAFCDRIMGHAESESFAGPSYEQKWLEQ